jgi:glycosyltransferase involved in cell wall biosynthesis
VKRFDRLLDQMLVVRRAVPDVTLTLVGDGPERARLDEWVALHDASSWVHFAGRVSRDDLRDLYRRAWVVASASLAEGWGLALTEAAGCGTPAVATDIAGHRCSVIDGSTGLLASVDDLATPLVTVLTDTERRRELSHQAEARARSLTWDALAADVLRPLHRQVLSRSAR